MDQAGRQAALTQQNNNIGRGEGKKVSCLRIMGGTIWRHKLKNLSRSAHLKTSQTHKDTTTVEALDGGEGPEEPPS